MDSKQFLNWIEHSQLAAGSFSKYPLIMGILNVTPDSFSDGGLFLSRDNACEYALQLISQGADLIDIGGQSTRPGAQEVSIEIELRRVIPVIESIRSRSDICISIDTNKPEVMEAAVHAGANLINDVYALRAKNALTMVAKLAVPVCLMHMQGEPQNMQNAPYYPKGVLSDITNFFEKLIRECEDNGIKRQNIILDPGFGFGKSVQDNLLLVKKLDTFATFGLPLLLGASRKSTIGAILGKEVHDRLIGGIAVAIYAALKGVGIIRTHDVNETKQALHMINRICESDVTSTDNIDLNER